MSKNFQFDFKNKLKLLKKLFLIFFAYLMNGVMHKEEDIYTGLLLVRVLKTSIIAKKNTWNVSATLARTTPF